MHERKLKAGESVTDYVEEMLELSARQPDMGPEMCADLIITNLDHQGARQHFRIMDRLFLAQNVFNHSVADRLLATAANLDADHPEPFKEAEAGKMMVAAAGYGEAPRESSSRGNSHRKEFSKELIPCELCRTERHSTAMCWRLFPEYAPPGWRQVPSNSQRVEKVQKTHAHLRVKYAEEARQKYQRKTQRSSNQDQNARSSTPSPYARPSSS